MLLAQSPAGMKMQFGVGFVPMDCIDGVVTENVFPMSYRWPSYDPKKKALSLTMAPPRLTPNCSRVLPTLPAGGVLKKLRASMTPSRPKANAVPCSVLVPDFIPTLTMAPGFQPYSAGGFCCRLNS